MQSSRSLEISPQIQNIRLVNQKMIEEIFRVSKDSDLTFRIDVAVTEAVANAIKHGSPNKDSKVKIDYKIVKDKYIFTISDEGKGPPEDIFNSPKLGSNLMTESKRGAFMIHWAADEIKQKTTDAGYTLTLVFIINKDADNTEQ